MDFEISPLIKTEVGAKSGREDHAIMSKITPIKQRHVKF